MAAGAGTLWVWGTWLAGAAVGIYGLVGALVYAGQRALLYPGGADSLPAPAEVGLADMAPVTLRTEDGLALTAWYRAPVLGPAGMTVLMAHGNAGTIADVAAKARVVLDGGFGLLLLEYRGFGGNPGRPTQDGLMADARAAIAFLKAQGARAETLAYYGESLGSGVVIHLAAETLDPAAIVVEGAFSRAVDVARLRYGWLPVKALMKDPWDSVAALAGLQAPLMILHGEQDRVVPVFLAKRLAEAAQGRVEAVYFPAGGHVDLMDHGAGPNVLAFFRRHAPIPDAGTEIGTGQREERAN